MSESYVCIVKTSVGLFLMMNKDGSISGGTQEQMLNYWTHSWERGLNMGGGFHTGACLSFIQFGPSVVSLPLEQLTEDVVGPKPEGGYELQVVRGEGGGFYGLACNGPKAQYWHDQGTKPAFFREE